jgi:hypothetical protein
MKDRLVLLHRQSPDEWEIHRYEVNQTKNLILTTKDSEFAMNLVDGYNFITEDEDEWLAELEKRQL